jgi:hypothetical protein
MSRRNFVYGTAAAAAGAVLFRGVPRPTMRSAHGVRPADDGSAGFGVPVVGPEVDGTGSVNLTLSSGPPYVASTAGALLVATVISSDPDTPFTPPTGQDWRLAQAVPFGSGRAEIWYTPGTPPSPGNIGGITESTFSVVTTPPSTADCRGAMSQYSMPAGLMPVFDAIGQATSISDPGLAAGDFALTATSGNITGDLGIALAVNFFTSGVGAGGTWTGPSGTGWEPLRHLGNGVPHCWGSWYNQALTSSAPQSLTASFSYTNSSTEDGWAFLYAAFRLVAFQPIWLGGGEMTTMVALDPTGQELVMAGDVEGLWRTYDYGDHWQLSQDGLTGQDWRCIASLAWSELEPGTVYACVGKTDTATDGGFLVSADGGVTWSMRSPDVQFQGGAAGSPPRPSAEGQDTDRSTGHLIAQDPTGTGWLYAASYNSGIFSSNDLGQNWNFAGLTKNTTSQTNQYYPRSLVINPDNNQELWAGCWDSDGTGTYGGVWHCSQAQSASANSYWTQLPAFPSSAGSHKGSVSDLKIIDGWLYASVTTMGVYRYQIGAGGSWENLGDSTYFPPAGNQLWTSIDGYANGSDHIIVAGCGFGQQLGSNTNYTNIVQITVGASPGSTPSYADLTGGAQINLTPVPPDGQPWWRASDVGSGWTYWLGGQDFVNPHILINPNDQDTIYVAGAGGFFITTNAGAATQPGGQVVWDLACNGAPMASCDIITADPSTPGHVILSGSDFTHVDLTDPSGWNTTSGVYGVPLPSGYASHESHACTFAPNSDIFIGVNTKYGKNTGAGVLWRPDGGTGPFSSSVWTDTEFATGATTSAPTGICASNDASGDLYVLVVTQSAGMWRGTPPTGGSGGWTWVQVDASIGTDGSIGMISPIIAGNNGYIYCMDRMQGIWRSNNYGVSWSLIYSFGSPNPVLDGRSGWLARNPAASSQLWFSTNTGLYMMTGASGGSPSVTQMAASSFPYGAGSMVFDSTGTIYAVALNGVQSDGSDPFSTQLLTCPTPATVGSTWSNAAGPDGSSVGSYSSWPQSIALTTVDGNTVIMLGSLEDWCVYGTPIT